MKQLIKMLMNLAMITAFISGVATAQQSFTPTGNEMAFEQTGSGTNRTFASPATGEAKKSKKDIKEMKANLKVEKINFRVNNNLLKNHKDARDIKVSHESKAIVAKFTTSDGKAARRVYNKGGAWMYTIITYYEDQLPKAVKDIVQSHYPLFDITLVQEINQDDAIIHKVFLEDCTSFKQVLVHNANLTVYEDFKKSK